MTNTQLIEIAKTRLAKDGVLSYTGRMISGINLATGERVQIPEIEPIHTFLGWRERGYKIKKGEISYIKFPIWYFSKKKNCETGSNIPERGDCHMRNTAWFTLKQVEPIPGK